MLCKSEPEQPQVSLAVLPSAVSTSLPIAMLCTCQCAWQGTRQGCCSARAAGTAAVQPLAHALRNLSALYAPLLPTPAACAARFAADGFACTLLADVTYHACAHVTRNRHRNM